MNMIKLEQWNSHQRSLLAIVGLTVCLLEDEIANQFVDSICFAQFTDSHSISN